MKTQQYTMIPTLTTPAGSCLTTKNWQEAGVQRASYSLAHLLVKPGLAYLKTLPKWEFYSGWEGDWVLNASMPAPNSEGNFVFRSPYDGTRITCSVTDIVDIIMHLKPQEVVVPKGFYCVKEDVLSALTEVTSLVIPICDKAYYSSQSIHGIYYFFDPMSQPKDIVDLVAQHQTQYPDLVCFLAGSLSFPLIKKLYQSALNAKIMLESDYPARDGFEGIVYCQEGMIDLREKDYSMQFECIDSACQCPTCEQPFTKAYLHHLLEHTPLLCQRLLIQHNAYYCSHGIR